MISRAVSRTDRMPTPRAAAAPVLTVAFLASLLGCQFDRAAPAPAAAAVPVTVAEVVQRTVPIQVSAIGNVEAYSTVGVKPQVTGEIIGVHFSEGQDVTKGQRLFTIDPRPFRADLDRAEAALIQDQARARNAEQQAARYTRLVEEGVASREQADQLQTNYEALQAAVNADRAAVEYYKVQLSYTRIAAPIDGRTGDLMLHLGNVVKANPDTPMVTINQVEPIYVDFSVPQQVLPEIREYAAQGELAISALLPGQEERPEEGTLSFIDNAVSLTTGTIKLKGTFPNRQRRLWPGQFVNVVLTLAREPNAIVVPSQAVLSGQEGQYVFVVTPELTAESRPVVPGRSLNGATVIASGLQPGEKVVTDGQVRLLPGSSVEIRDAGIPFGDGRP
jgi:multidrug efflux system membrane fusion protein